MQRVGTTIGYLLAGFMPNMFGRKRSLQLAVVINSIFLVVLIFANQPAFYAVCLTICEACNGFTVVNCSAYGVEVIGPKYRVYFGAIVSIASSLGFVLITILAMFLPDRQILTTAMASIFALNLLYVHAIPESPVWALTKSRFKEARKSIHTLSASLNMHDQGQVKNYIRRLSNASERRASIISQIDLARLQQRQGWRWKLANSSIGQLFKDKLIRQFTLLSLTTYASVTIANVGSKYYVRKLPGNIYFNSCLTGVAELIGSLATFPLIRRFGMKNTSMGLNLAAGCSMLVTMGLLQSPQEVTQSAGVYMSFVAKVLNIGGWSSQVSYIANLFPSDVRSTGIALARLASVFTLVAPLILTATWEWLPLATFGVLSLIGGLLQHFLPDLTDVPMFLSTDDQQRYFNKVIKLERKQILIMLHLGYGNKDNRSKHKT